MSDRELLRLEGQTRRRVANLHRLLTRGHGKLRPSYDLDRDRLARLVAEWRRRRCLTPVT